VIFVEEGEESVIYAAPLDSGDAEYFLKAIVVTLRAFSDEQYMNGPAAIPHTFARSSYVLYQKSVYWCIEWEPGLIVIRFSSDGMMAWTVLRSPNPTFGRRTPTEADLRDYDETAINHQYNLVFRAWDAQFEEDTRRFRNFTPADATTIETYRAAFEHANALGDRLQSRYSEGAGFERWLAQCKANIAEWAGEGIRVPKAWTE
jgi:hypothetical protein